MTPKGLHGRAAIAVMAMMGAVAARPAAADGTPPPSPSPTTPATYRASLPILFQIDPVNKILTTTQQPGQLQALDTGGNVVATQPLPFTLSNTPAAGGTGFAAPGCSPDANNTTRADAHPYAPTYAHSDADKEQMLYEFQIIQLDNAQILYDSNRNPYPTRQFMECNSGGGQTKDGSSIKNTGAGAAMVDSNPVILLAGSPTWGTVINNGVVMATHSFTVGYGKLSYTSSTTEPYGGDTWSGSQGVSNDNAYTLNGYSSNEVVGYWQGNADSNQYKGNGSLAVWEYPMSNGNGPTSIRAQSWLTYECGGAFFWKDWCTTLGSAPVHHTRYQGTWKVCGNAPTICVTSVGAGTIDGFTTSGNTSVPATGGAVTTTATGLKTSAVSATYEVKYMAVAPTGAHADCAGTFSTRISNGTISTDANGNFGPSAALSLPLDVAGVATVCVVEVTPTAKGTGNEAPVTRD